MSVPAICLVLVAYAVLFGAGAVLERLGVPAELLSRLLTATVLCGAALMFMARGTTSEERYMVGERPFRPLAAGAWTGLHATSAIALVALAAFSAGDRAAALVLALALPVGLLIAGALAMPAIGASGARTLPDFLARPDGRPAARLAGAAVAVSVCVLLAAGLMQAGAWCAAALLGLSQTHAALLAAGFVLLAAIPGGMKAQGGVQPVHVLIVGVTVAALAAWTAGSPGLSPEWGLDAAAGWLPSGGSAAALELLLPALGAAAGIASLPTLLAPAFAAGRRATDRRMPSGSALAWSLAFALPLAGTLALLATALPLPGEAGWWPASAAASIPGMPLALFVLAAAAATVAALSLAAALVIAAGSTLSHDLYGGLLDGRATEGRRLFVSRLLAVLAALALSYAASSELVDGPAAASWALALAAAGLFPALVLGASWKRASGRGAVAGIAAGFGLCLYLLAASRYGLPAPAFARAEPGQAAALAHFRAAALGMAAGFAVAIAASLLGETVRKKPEPMPDSP